MGTGKVEQGMHSCYVYDMVYSHDESSKRNMASVHAGHRCRWLKGLPGHLAGPRREQLASLLW